MYSSLLAIQSILFFNQLKIRAPSEFGEGLHVSSNLLSRLILLLSFLCRWLSLLVILGRLQVTPATSLSVVTGASAVALLTVPLVVTTATTGPLISGRATSFVIELVVFISDVSLLAVAHLILNFVDFGANIVFELSVGGLALSMLLRLDQVVVLSELGLALDLLDGALELECFTDLNKHLVNFWQLLKISGWRHLQRAELLNGGVVEIDAALVFVVEGAGAVAFTTLALLGLLEGA